MTWRPCSEDEPMAMPPAGGYIGDWREWWIQVTRDYGRRARPVDVVADQKRLPDWLPLPAAVHMMRCVQC